MSQIQDVDLAALERLSSHLSAVLGTIEGHHHALATPCADWDLAALVDHVTGGNWFTVQILDGHSAEDALARARNRFGTDPDAATDISERAASSVVEHLAAFGQPHILEQTHHHVAGVLTGRQILRLRLQDLIIHSWDIDQTLAPPATIPEDLVRWGLNELIAPDSLTAQHFGLAATPTPGTAEDLAGAGASEATYRGHFGRTTSR